MVTDFSFDGTTLSDKGYMLCDFSGNTEETIEVSMMDYAEIKAPLSDKSHKVATSYPNNYTRTLQICKIDCSGQDPNLTLSNSDISAITRWLCRKEYKWFHWIYDTEAENYDLIEYLVHCKVSKIVFGGECHGLEITLVTNAPYGFGAENTVSKNVSIGGSITIGPDIGLIDEECFIYPYMEVYFKRAGNWTFTNTTSWTGQPPFPDKNRKTVINNVSQYETIVIAGGDVLQIEAYDSSGETMHPNLYRDFNFVFPRICCTYTTGNNSFKSEGVNVRITYKYRPIRKVGL